MKPLAANRKARLVWRAIQVGRDSGNICRVTAGPTMVKYPGGC